MGIISWELIRRGIIIRSGSQRNLITDAGMNAIATTSNITSTGFVGVGTGSTAPANAQTALIAEVGRVNHTTTGDGAVASGPAFAYWSLKRVHIFFETEGNGNLTEVGYFNQASGGTMFCRQLFKDALGVPTTVIKTINDQLKITYELRLYSPAADSVQSGLVISGVSYDITTRAREIDLNTIWGWNGSTAGFLGIAGGVFASPGGRAYEAGTALGTTQSGLSGANAAASSSTIGSYVAGTFYRDNTMKWEPTDGNLAGGIGGIHSFGGGTTEMFQSKFTPAFAKDAVKRLTLVVRCSWARYP